MKNKKLKRLDHFQLCILLEYAAEIGAIHALIHAGKVRPYLNRSQADRKYGRNTVNKWVSRGWITVRKDGQHSAPLRIDRVELESVARASDFIRNHLYYGQ